MLIRSIYELEHGVLGLGLIRYSDYGDFVLDGLHDYVGLKEWHVGYPIMDGYRSICILCICDFIEGEFEVYLHICS